MLQGVTVDARAVAGPVGELALSKKTARKPARSRKSAAVPRPHSRPAKKGAPRAARARSRSAAPKATKPSAAPVAVKARPAPIRPTRPAPKERGRGKAGSGPAGVATAQAAVTSEALELPAKLEPRLTPEEVEQFRRMLIDKRAEILGDVSTLHSEALNKNRREASGDLSSMPIHMADLGTDNYEMEFTLGLIEGERAILKEIDEALERVRNGTYGICLATGRPIGKARLKAKPWAKFCYEYTLAQEKGQPRRF